MIEAEFDFLIVCHQRSGSHLLQTFLDSHPEINCLGEIGIDDPWSVMQGCKYRGGILMYNRVGFLKSQVPDRFIHLIRNPRMTAVSAVKNSALRKRTGAGHNAHRIRGGDPKPDIQVDMDTVNRRTAHIKGRQKRMSRLLRTYRRPILTVTYEELTDGGKDVEFCPEGVMRRLTEFLGVEPVRLRTPLMRDR